MEVIVAASELTHTKHSQDIAQASSLPLVCIVQYVASGPNDGVRRDTYKTNHMLHDLLIGSH